MKKSTQVVLMKAKRSSDFFSDCLSAYDSMFKIQIQSFHYQNGDWLCLPVSMPNYNSEIVKNENGITKGYFLLN